VPHKKCGAIDTINRLQKFVSHHPPLAFPSLDDLLDSFLESKSLYGTGIDCRFTAFFAPNNTSIPPKVIEELDKAAVELVWVSGKREDADRKLGFRISQEIQVRIPPLSVPHSSSDLRFFLPLRLCS
jgi:hypothetical protein